MTSTRTESYPQIWQRPVPWTARSPIWYAWLALNIAGVLLFRLPFWCLRMIPRRMRQDPAWGYATAIKTKIIKTTFSVGPTIRPELTLPPEARGSKKELFEKIPPAPDSLLRGVADPKNTVVKPASRPGCWYPTRLDKEAAPKPKVVIYFFGGAFVMGNHTDLLGVGIFERITSMLGREAKVLTVGYRLASTRGNHFPAQLQDAIAAYHHILGLGILPSDIFLGGDSSGGNIVLQLLRYLSDMTGIDLPLPAAAFVSSPWLDMSHDWSRVAENRNYGTDVITPEILSWGVDAVVPCDMRPDGPYFSPGLHPFKVPIPLFIDTDANEIFFDDLVKAARKLQEIPHNRVQLHTTEHGTHTTLSWGLAIGFDKCVDSSLAALKFFLEENHCI